MARKPKIPKAPNQKPWPSYGKVVPNGGVPPPYDPVWAQRVIEASNVGYTQMELCRLLGISLDTLNLWALVHSDFAEALRINSQARHDRVEAALYQRAVGYEHPSEKIGYDKDAGVWRAKTTVHIPADPNAAFNWLKQHRGWSDKTQVQHSGTIGTDLTKLSNDDLVKLAIILEAATPDAPKTDEG